MKRLVPRLRQFLNWYLPGVAAPVRRQLVLGILAAAVVFTCIALLYALFGPPLKTADEALHLDYALSISQLHIPLFFEGPRLSIPGVYFPDVQWVSQHPPLYYLVQAPFVALANALTDPSGMVFVGRLVSIAIGLCAVLAIPPILARWRLAPVIILGTTVLFSVTLMHIGTSAAIYNDSLSTLLSILTLGVTGYIVLEGPTRRRVLLLTLLVALALATRASLIVTVLISCLGLASTYFVHRERLQLSGLKSAAKGLLVAAGAAIFTALTSGWYYIHNFLYSGSFVGSQPEWAAEHLHRKVFSLAAVVKRSDVQQQILTVLSEEHVVRWLCVGLIVVAVVGLVAWAMRAKTAHSRRLCIVVGLLVLHALGIFALLVQYIMSGGANNIRYLLPIFMSFLLLVSIGAFYLRTLGKVLVGILFFAGLYTALFGTMRLTGARLYTIANGSLHFAVPKPVLIAVTLILGTGIIIASTWLIVTLFRLKGTTLTSKARV
ncbi:MAG TPA: hypothetical protein VFZ48_05900 [Candidatus Saccharimonadales bacterium]